MLPNSFAGMFKYDNNSSVDNWMFQHCQCNEAGTHPEHTLLSIAVRTSSGVTEKGGSTLNIKDIVPHAVYQTE